MCRFIVSKSLNGGSTWTRYIRSTDTGYCYAVAVNPLNTNIVYAGGCTNAGVVLQKTTNSGVSWSSIATGITSDTITSIAIDPENPNSVYAGTPDGIYKSTNAGVSWSYSGCSNISEIIIDPTQNNVLYAGTQNGVYKSTNYGISWNEMNDGLTCLNITCMDISPDQYLYCGTDSIGIFRWSLALCVDEHIHQPFSGNDLVHVMPSPSYNNAMIYFKLTAATEVGITLYNTQGRVIKTYATKEYAAGTHSISWDGCDCYGHDMASGVYFVKIQTGEHTATTKISLINR